MPKIYTKVCMLCKYYNLLKSWPELIRGPTRDSKFNTDIYGEMFKNLIFKNNVNSVPICDITIHASSNDVDSKLLKSEEVEVWNRNIKKKFNFFSF